MRNKNEIETTFNTKCHNCVVTIKLSQSNFGKERLVYIDITLLQLEKNKLMILIIISPTTCTIICLVEYPFVFLIFIHTSSVIQHNIVIVGDISIHEIRA